MPISSRSTASRASGKPYQRRWRIPPPYLRGSEPIEGATILEEVPGALGLLLWQCARDVGLWAVTPRDEREGLFTPDAEERRLAALLAIGAPARGLEAPLRAAAAMLSHPADTAPEAMMLACQRISQWAEVEGATGTALLFAQAAALAMPASARTALRVGRLARQRGEYPRAEGWIQRSIVLARQGGERETHAWGYTTLGQLHTLRGNMPAAERCHLRALRIARRHSLISREAAALHDLFVVSAERGAFGVAIEWARQAAAAYGPHHPHLPFLSHDVAAVWMEQGRFDQALRVLVAVAKRIESPRNMTALANIVRAAGAIGDRQRVEEHWGPAYKSATSGQVKVLAPTALLNLARGAAGLGELERARTTAQEAIHLAEQMGEAKTIFQAESLLASLGAAQAVTNPAIAPSPEEEALANALAEELVSSLVMVAA